MFKRMFSRISLSLIIAFFTVTMVFASALVFNKKLRPNTIVIDTENTLVLDQEVNTLSASRIVEGILTSTAPTINLYIKSPGGSVMDGTRLINVIHNTNKKINCIIDVAASMAFAITQACDNRMIAENGVLMQHVASYGLEMQQQPNAESFVQFLSRLLEYNNKLQAERIGITLEDFNKKVRNDWWLFGKEAVEQNAADEVVNVVCTEKMLKSERINKVATMFGAVDVVFNACPLIDIPKSVPKPREMKEEDFLKFYDNLIVRNRVMSFYKRG